MAYTLEQDGDGERTVRAPHVIRRVKSIYITQGATHNSIKHWS
jgi:hypothetical protein